MRGHNKSYISYLYYMCMCVCVCVCMCMCVYMCVCTCVYTYLLFPIYHIFVVQFPLLKILLCIYYIVLFIPQRTLRILKKLNLYGTKFVWYTNLYGIVCMVY